LFSQIDVCRQDYFMEYEPMLIKKMEKKTRRKRRIKKTTN